MFTFLLWCLLFVLCWPIALLALVLYPFIWLLLLPFRLVGTRFTGAGAGVGNRDPSREAAGATFQSLTLVVSEIHEPRRTRRCES